jgi:hypothetical protein
MFCLGATKAGTSWLYRHLLGHPECRFRTIKELHYFTMTRPSQFDKALREAEDKIRQLTARLTSAGSEKRADLARQVDDLTDWREVLAHRAVDVAAYRRFLLKDAESMRLVGDVTPAYSLMPEDQLRNLAQVAADTRFVYLIRDPLARLWSHVRMIAARTAPAENFAGESSAILGRILTGDMSGEGQGIVDRGDYATVIGKIRRALPVEKVLVQFQEDLLTLPGIARLSAFLGLTPAVAALERRVNEGRDLALPEAWRARALVWLRPQYEYAASLFPALPEAWRRNMEEGFA